MSYLVENAEDRFSHDEAHPFLQGLILSTGRLLLLMENQKCHKMHQV